MIPPLIVVVGGANVDLKSKVLAKHRLGTSNPARISISAGGVGRNIAHNLGSLGNAVALISAVGEDAFGERLLRETKLAGVDISAVLTVPGATTGAYLATLENSGELVTATSDMEVMARVDADHIKRQAELLDLAAIVVADCNLAIEALDMVAQLAAHKLIVEPVSVEKCKKIIHLSSVHRLFCITPNHDQAHALTGETEEARMILALHGLGVANVVLHKGAAGALVSDGLTLEALAAQPCGDVLDVTGAGDAAVSGLAQGLSRNQSLRVAAQFGQELAGRVVASPYSTLSGES